MIIRCKTCGKEFYRTPGDCYKEKNHFCSPKCAGASLKKRYSVYDNKTTLPVIVSGTAVECARAMGLKDNGFHKARWQNAKYGSKKWTIIEETDEVEL